MRNAESRSGPERGINRWRARCPESGHAGFGGRLHGKARIHTEYGTSPCSPPYQESRPAGEDGKAVRRAKGHR
jgi:hypothetical protein